MLKIVNAATPQHEAQMRAFGKFVGVDEIHYIDHGNKEEYILHKKGETLTFFASYNRDQGGFLTVSMPEHNDV